VSKFPRGGKEGEDSLKRVNDGRGDGLNCASCKGSKGGEMGEFSWYLLWGRSTGRVKKFGKKGGKNTTKMKRNKGEVKSKSCRLGRWGRNKRAGRNPQDRMGRKRPKCMKKRDNTGLGRLKLPASSPVQS